MACKDCTDKASKKPATNAAAQLELSRGRALNLLAGTEFAGGLSSKSASSELIDALMAALVDARETQRALSEALARGSDCSAIEEELKAAEDALMRCEKELDALHELCDGDHDEVTQDGVPVDTTVSQQKVEQRSRAQALSQLRPQEVRPGNPTGHVPDVHAVHDGRVLQPKRPVPVRFR